MIQLPKGMRILTPQQSRMFRRLARKALRPMHIRKAMQPIGELVQSQLDGLPPTTFRCECNKRVYVYEPGADGRAFTVRHAPGAKQTHMECPEHGKLENFTIADWRAEWERRGRPAHLNWRRRPLC